MKTKAELSRWEKLAKRNGKNKLLLITSYMKNDYSKTSWKKLSTLFELRNCHVSRYDFFPANKNFPDANGGKEGIRISEKVVREIYVDTINLVSWIEKDFIRIRKIWIITQHSNNQERAYFCGWFIFKTWYWTWSLCSMFSGSSSMWWSYARLHSITTPWSRAVL